MTKQREIKFRYWEVFNTEMKDFDPYLCASILAKQSEDFILLQYTGLKDKNGKEIYEGDIISYGNVGASNDIVKYEEGGFKPFINMAGPHAEEIEVIGNIYENPTLIKG